MVSKAFTSKEASFREESAVLGAFAIDRILYRQFAELALKHAEHRVGLYWPAIRNVAEKLRVSRIPHRRGSRKHSMEFPTRSEGEELSSKFSRIPAKIRRPMRAATVQQPRRIS